MNRSTYVGLGGVAAAGGLLVMFACSSSSAPPPPPASSAGQCTTEAGAFPVANCVPYDPSTQSCQPGGTCDTSPCKASSACLAMADNTGAAVASLRMRKLLVTAPSTLAFEPPGHVFVQHVVIDDGINLADNECGEPNGTGTFNWLIQIDTANKKLTTGGAPPTSDPFGTGYCFVNASIEGLSVGPVTVDLTPNQDGSYDSAAISKLYVPIFVAAGSSTQMGAPSVVVLPLSNAQMKSIKLSDSNNCIGQYNANAVSTTGAKNNCFSDDGTCVRWTTAGALAGFITLDDADGVDVPQLAESLCVLLANPATTDPTDPNEKHCIKGSDGHVMAKGDFCSTTNKPGGCADSYWLSATFAASAAKISATPNQPACMGQVITGDSGAGDSGSPADAQGQ